ncbi:MAG: DNA recombination protein RmuC [Ginsengibacter sp.]
MLTIYLFLSLLALLLILNIFLTLRSKSTNEADLTLPLQNLDKNLERIGNSIQTEFSTSRSEASQNNKNLREETINQLRNFGHTMGQSIDSISKLQSHQLEIFSQQLTALTQTNEQKLDKLRTTIEGKLDIFKIGFDNNTKLSRKELKDNLDQFKSELNYSLKDFSDRQRENFSDLITNQRTQNAAHGDKLTLMNSTIGKSIKELQDDNSAKLEKMRETVDEKLQKTLETRLGESFKLVSERLEAVHKGLGDMQQLATGVGDLKRVLTNVKSRGVLGEYQLENILEQLLTPDQYEKNVKTKPAFNGVVEFAVKLPGKENKEEVVWLPIDSKFPKEDFELLINAYDNGSAEHIEECRRTFTRGIKKCASDICGKYIDPPNTTDFAIMFLPFESLYAEVLRTPGLFETIQRECKIIVTGPTTLSAILSSLQMGFRTLAIEKRSGEVWHLLSAVKTDFGSFGEILKRTHKKLQEASNVIEQAGVKSRAIEKKLKDVQLLPQKSTNGIHDTIDVIADEAENEREEKEPALS